MTLEKANPDANGPPPMDLVTSSAQRHRSRHLARSGVLGGAARCEGAASLAFDSVNALDRAHVRGPQFGFLGEPHVNVLELNLALDGLHPLVWTLRWFASFDWARASTMQLAGAGIE